MESKENKDAVVERTANEAGTSTAKNDGARSTELENGLRELVSGRASLVMGDVSAAVDSLASACELLGKHYGEGAKECSDAYFFYGKALLEMARVEDGVLENVLDAGDDGDDEDDDDEEGDEGEEEGDKEDESKSEESTNGATKHDEAAKADKGEDSKGDEAAKKQSSIADEAGPSGHDEQKKEGNVDKAHKEEENGDKDGENESIGSNEAGTSSSKDCKDKTIVDNEDVEDLPNVQLSWEMLELAKMGYQKMIEDTKDEEKLVSLEDKLSETYQMLGEVSIEGENYPQALEDLSACLQRRTQMLPSDSRAIAETHYQLGLALSFASHFDRSVAAFKEAINVLKMRVNNLKENKISHDPAKKVDEFYSPTKEVSDIESLIPLIEEKITETDEMKIEAERKASVATSDTEEITEKSKNKDLVKKSTDKVEQRKDDAMDISHMVRKRKAIVDSNGDGEQQPKRQHVESEQKE